ncbi:MAG: ABC transporter ATP-binding protein [Chloroflexota bacterium]|nr:ABC transporter ATP-binding protein [Chloroflexota bacterium]
MHWMFRGDVDTRSVKKLTWATVVRVLRYSRPYWGVLTGGLFLILIQTGINLVQPLLFRELIDNALPNRNVELINVLALGLVFIPIIDNIVGIAVRYLNSKVGEGVIYDLRRNLYAHLQRMSLRFFTHTQGGELISRLNSDVINAQGAISDTLVGSVTQGINLIATLIIMLALEWRLTLLGLLVFPFFYLLARFVGVKLRAITRESMELNAQMNAMMNETLNIGGALLVKLFGQHKVETNRFERRAARVRDIGIKRAVFSSQFWAMMGLIGVVGSGLVYFIGSYLFLSNIFTIGTIVAFSGYLSRLYGPLQYLINVPVQFATSVVSFERVFEVIDLPLDIAEKPDAHVLKDSRGELVFDHVTFRYDNGRAGLLGDFERVGRMENVRTVLSLDDAGAPSTNGNKARSGKNGKPDGDESALIAPHVQARDIALEDIDFALRPGQLAALVGPSGAGKTTLTYLIPRLYDPTSGRITLDGHDLRDVTLDSLASQIGMVTQETYLFHDTIRTNLLYAKPDATQAELEAACRAANLHDFIAALPEGYDTVAGERGYRLSGGEKQRLAIARVILKNPRVLVLDEATSHLDSQSEALIQEALTRIMASRTSIVIAHRLSTVLAADVIFVVDRGQIIERGTHAELLAANGLYMELYETQFRAQREDVESDIAAAI